MSHYFYGLVQQQGPWATTDVDVLRATQPRVTQSVVHGDIGGGGTINIPPPGVTGVLAGNAGYGMGAGYGFSTGGKSINGIHSTPIGTTGQAANDFIQNARNNGALTGAGGTLSAGNFGKPNVKLTPAQIAAATAQYQANNAKENLTSGQAANSFNAVALKNGGALGTVGNFGIPQSQLNAKSQPTKGISGGGYKAIPNSAASITGGVGSITQGAKAGGTAY